jgi:uncharacterized membrane protein YfhO
VRRYALPSGAGRFFFPRSSRLASDDETFADLRKPEFSYEEAAFVARSPVPLPPPRGRRGWAVGRMLVDEPERTEIATSCSDPGLVVLTRTFDPGWKVQLDGLATEPLRADLALLAVPVPAGEHRIALAYAPRSWRWGRVVSGISLLLVAALWMSAPRRDRP